MNEYAYVVPTILFALFLLTANLVAFIGIVIHRICFHSKRRSNPNRRLNANANPNVNANVNPSFNPNYNPSYNPNFNPNYNPNFNPDFNPHHNPDFNPHHNPPFNPEYTPVDPKFQQDRPYGKDGRLAMDSHTNRNLYSLDHPHPNRLFNLFVIISGTLGGCLGGWLALCLLQYRIWDREFRIKYLQVTFAGFAFALIMVFTVVIATVTLYLMT